MEFGDGRHSSQHQPSTRFPAPKLHEEKLKQAVMELFSETYHSNPSSNARFESVHKEKIKKLIEDRLSSLFPVILDNPPNHPPYAVMVMAAIKGLNEKRGSKEESISKYIKQHYENLPWAHPTILRNHLEKLVETGEILYVSKSRYLLPKSTDPEPNPSPKCEQQPKRKQGRETEQQVVRSEDDELIVIPKSKRTRVVEAECLLKQMPGRCLRPEQVEQRKIVEKSGFNENGLTVHENEPLRLVFKFGSKQKSKGRGRPPKKQDTKQVEQQKLVGETESNEDRSNQQPTDGMQQKLVGETKEDCSDQNAALGIIVENETNHNGLAGIEQLAEQPPVEESDINVDHSNHHSVGMEVENQTDEDGSNHHVTVGTEVESETNHDGTEQHLMIEQEEQQLLVEKIDIDEDGSVVIEHVEQPQPVVERSNINEDGSNQHPAGGIEVGTTTKEDVLKLHVTVGTEVGWETHDDCLEQHLRDGIEQVEQHPPAEKPDVNEDGSVVIEHVEQPQPVVEGSDINEVGSNQHPTGGIEVGTEANKDGKLHVTVDAAMGWETNADGSRQHLIDGIEQEEQQPPVEKIDSKEDGAVGFEQVEEQQPLQGSGVSQDGSNQHSTFGIEGTEAKGEGLKQYGLVGIEVESGTIDGCLRQHSVGEIEQVRQNLLVEKSYLSEDGLIIPPDIHLTVKTAMGSMPHRRMPAQKQDTEQVELQKPANESKSCEDGMNQHPTSGIEVTPLQQVNSGGRSPEKNKLRRQQEKVNDAIESTDAIDGLIVPLLPKVVTEKEVEPAAVTKEEEPMPVRQIRERARKKCIPEQQQAMSDAVEPGDGNGAKVEVAVTEEVEPATVPKEEEPNLVRQTRGMTRKKCTPKQLQVMSDAVEPGDGNGAKVEVAVTEEVEPVAVPKEEEPNPVRQTRGRACKKCTPEQQLQAMSDATARSRKAVEVALKEDEGKLHLPRRGLGGQGRGRPPKKHVHVHEPQQEEEIIVLAEEEEKKSHGRGGRQRGIGREETIVPAAEKVQKLCERGGRQRGRGREETMVAAEEEEQKPCGQGGRRRGRCPEETVVVVEEEEQETCRQGRGRERGREETMQRKRNKTHVNEDEVERKQWWQKWSNKSHVDKEEVKREVEEEERP